MAQPYRTVYIGLEIEIPLQILEFRMNSRELISLVLKEIRTITPCISDTGRGVWTTDGLFHNDNGFLEFSSRECASPQELSYVVERAIRTVAIAISRIQQARGVSILAQLNSCDYQGSGWGYHLNLSLPVDIGLNDVIPLMSLMATISVISGTGGFEDPDGYGFVLSPRMTGIDCAVNGGTKSSIIHNLREKLSIDANRLHLCLLSYAQSQKTRLLSIGVPAIGELLIELNAAPEVKLSQPVLSLQTVIRDERCRTRLPLENRGEMTALDIQRQWLTAAQTHLESLPPWAPEVCVLWDECLTALENGDRAVDKWLEWRMKLLAYRSYCLHHGLPWRHFKEIGAVAGMAAEIAPEDEFETFLENPVVRSFLKVLLALRSLGLEDFEKWIRIKKSLLEADIRWAQIGPESLFCSMEDTGILEHRILSEAEISDGTTYLPSGRAAARVEFIRQFARNDHDTAMDWTVLLCKCSRMEMMNVNQQYDLKYYFEEIEKQD